MANLTAPKEYKRLSQMLPAMKGLAILLVVAYHIWGFTNGYDSFSEIVTKAKAGGSKGIVEGLLSLGCLLGQQGVHIFLVASGFGLAASWWRSYGIENKQERVFSVLGFWQRRLLRILPLYWVAHSLALLLFWIDAKWVPFGTDVFNSGGFGTITALFLSLTTLRNFFIDYYYFLNGAWWYIGLAVQLYLIFPLLVGIGKRWGWSNLLAGSLLVSLGYRAIICILPLSSNVTEVLFRGAIFPARLFEFVFGMILAIALLQPQLKRSELILQESKKFLSEIQWIWLSGLLFAIGNTFYCASVEGWTALRIFSDPIIAVGEFCFIFQLMSLLSFPKKWLNLIGDYSYGIYLTHTTFFVALWALLIKIIPSYWLCFSVVISSCCFLGGLFEFGYNWLEKRYLEFKN